ncbi:MAG: pyridoxal phosphate-dependent aminotransferase family protein [Spirochaetaceae bacterium]|nr:MAG: pyridoxal phosphate-dependent aminotransferase family protein [Spirochaetaceae bacterium]
MKVDTHADIFQKCYDFHEADQAREEGWYPYFRPIQENRGSRVVIDGREMIMAGSNNYLGLAMDARVKEAARAAIAKYGTSCSGSRFMNGTFDEHEELERSLAEFVGMEAALCFTTGYQTNLGAISALLGPKDYLFTDKYNHASIMDGIFMASGIHRTATILRYKHNNMEDLERALRRAPAESPKLIVSDGVFSMEGDIVKLPEMKEIADRYGARVYIDDAHSMGVIGENGGGTLDHYGDVNLCDLLMCTFSKSFGSIGGFIAGAADVIDYIRHFARPLIFSASMSPPNTAAARASLEIIRTEPERVHRLQAIARKMIDGFSSIGFDVGHTVTPIVPLHIGDYDKTFLFWRALFAAGIYVNPVISPAVPPNRSLIRTSFMAIHTDDELDQILEVSEREAKRLGII